MSDGTGRMQSECRPISGAFSPVGRLEPDRQLEHVPIKRHGALHVADKLDRVVHSHQKRPPLNSSREAGQPERFVVHVAVGEHGGAAEEVPPAADVSESAASLLDDHRGRGNVPWTAQ